MNEMSIMKLKKAAFFCLTFLVCNFVHSFAFAQQSKVDSLLRILASAPRDTVRVNIYNQLFLEYEFVDDQKAGNYLDKALELATRIHYKKGIADSYIHLGYFAEDKGDYNEALVNYNNALNVAVEIKYKKQIASAHNSAGMVYSKQGNYSDAVSNCLKALKIIEEIGEKSDIAAGYLALGNIYNLQKNYSLALEKYLFSLNIYEQIGDKLGMAYSYNNIGLIHTAQGRYDYALENYKLSLEIHKFLSNKLGIALSYQNIGNNYSCLYNYKESFFFLFESLKIHEVLGNKSEIMNCYFSIACNFLKQKKYSEAQQYLLKTEKLATELGNKHLLVETYKSLASVEASVGDFKSAYSYDTLSTKYKDSIDNEQSRKKIVEAQMTYDFEKKELATKAEQEKKDILANEVLKQKTQQRNYFILAFVLLALLALFIFRGYKHKQKANRIIYKQKAEVEKAKSIIEEKNKDITDSINYAQRIQRAMLSDSDELKRLYPESFILFQPKDIVSGDFYFVHENNDFVYIAAADCTGHGVPGAFMSLIGTTKLQDAVAQSSNASDILMFLNRAIKTALKQTDANESTRDGMDIALCVVNKQTRALTFAGANRPLWLIRKNSKEVEEIKATKCAIGGLTSDSQHYDATVVDLAEDDTFYISTDGYADQFNGKTEKKLMTKKFKEILVDIQSQSMDEQKLFLTNFINDWKEGTEQVDDILVIGVRV
jgi:serine phosphatase RsbU (regulator of sigma subunit)/tetratricopeptide (TPR) repeat protein